MNPLVPIEVDLRDFAFMPLDVVRLRDSDLAALEEPAACWAAVLLWCASWHQVPAASIPDDDRVLANLAGFGRVVKEWQKVRDGALRGWLKCSDGRLYHPVVAEKALQAWREKQAQRWRTECARIKKHNQRHGTDHAVLEFEAWLSHGCPQGQPLYVPGTQPRCPESVPRETPSKGQGEGQGQGIEDSAPDGAGAAAAPPPTAEQAVALTKAELWAAGKSLLASQGMPKAQCGSFVGKLVKDHGDGVVVEAVRAAVVARPADAAEYLVGACRARSVNRAPVAPAESFRERDQRAAADRIAAFAPGVAARTSGPVRDDIIDMPEGRHAAARLG